MSSIEKKKESLKKKTKMKERSRLEVQPLNLSQLNPDSTFSKKNINLRLSNGLD